MKIRNLFRLILTFSFVSIFGTQSGGPLGAAPATDNDISGVVTGVKGPEAGVWVIAETTDLPTKFAKIVVTDDRGRFLLPDLPKANYKVWVRGYGLIDSQPVQSEPGKRLNFKVDVASYARAAASHYPAVYWYSMLKVPDESEFAEAARAKNGISNRMHS